MLVSRHLGSHPVVDFVVNPAVGLAPGLGIGWGGGIHGWRVIVRSAI